MSSKFCINLNLNCLTDLVPQIELNILSPTPSLIIKCPFYFKLLNY